MLIAPVGLGLVFSRAWPVLATGLVLPQFVLAPWTTPRGDNDGLWGLIFFFLVFVFVYAYAVAAASAFAVRWLADQRHQKSRLESSAR